MYRWLLFPIALTIWEGMAFANPQDPSVAAGEANFSDNGKALHITTGDRAIINWNNFSIEAGELTKFIQPGKHSAVLNRVTGTDISSLMGTLEANGKVFLVNPNGIIIGPNGIINAASFVGSTLDVQDADFMANRDLLFQGGSTAAIINYGSICVEDGNVALLGYRIENKGEIRAPDGSAAAAAGQEILLKPEFDEIAFIRPKMGGGINQEGIIEAVSVELKADGNPYNFAINHPGITRTTPAKVGGRIKLIAKDGNVQFSGKIKAEEGSVAIEGKEIYVPREAEIDVSASISGEGGEVIAFAEDRMVFYGKVKSEGGTEAGDGGFVEVSCPNEFDFLGSVSTQAPAGKTGTLLLDPTQITISLAANANISFGPAACLANTYCSPGAAANIEIGMIGMAGTLLDNLSMTNVIVEAVSGLGGLGDITIVDPFTWVSGNSLTLDAANRLIVNAMASCTGGGDIIVNAGSDVNITAIATPAGLNTDSGSITINLIGDINVAGGTAAGASASITTGSGPILIPAVINVNLDGGTMTDCYAEISSTTGSVTISSVIADVNVRGGTVATSVGAYAQIGKGTVPLVGVTTVNCPISIPSVGGTVLVQGGAASNAYAQIGHSPFTGSSAISAAGDISITTVAPFGFLNVYGGSAMGASAIIGHGNENSVYLQDCSGNITISSLRKIDILGGTADLSHAIIGFHSPSSGAMAPFTCVASPLISNNSIDVQVYGNDVINLTARTGSNAVIGYYNGNLGVAQPVDVQINGTMNLINVQTPILTSITLQAGNANGISAGAAAIGTFVSNAPANNAQSEITVTTSGLTILGPTGADDGSAVIANNNFLVPITTLTDNVAINMIAVGEHVILKGGLGANTGYAGIYGSNNLSMIVTGRLDVNRDFSGGMLQNGAARIQAGNNLNINTIFDGEIVSLYGGANANAEALIQCFNGAVTFGIPFLAKNPFLQIGEPGGTSQAPSRILTGGGTSVFSFQNGITLQAGTGAGTPPATAEIGSTNGELAFYLLGDLNIKGGSGDLAYAEISSLNGDLFFETQGNTILQGGNPILPNKGAYAQVGKGYLNNALLVTINSNILWQELVGSLTLLAGTGENCYAQIGHAPWGGIAPVDVSSGNITFDGGGIQNSVVLTAGAALNGTAIIGLGNELSTHLRNCAADISILGKTNLTLNAGTTPLNTHAVIGFHSPAAGSLGPLNVTSSSIEVVGFNTFLNAGNGTNAVIGYYNGTTAPGVNVAIQNITVDAFGLGVIHLQPGNNGGTTGGAAIIGTFVNAGSTVQSNIFTYSKDLNFLSPIGANDGNSIVLGIGSSVLLRTTNDILMERNSLMGNLGTGPISAIADRDIILTQNASVFTTSGDLALVVDNLFPIPPDRGPGRFIKDDGVSIDSATGGVRIFTATRAQNNVSGAINGTTFIPGTLFVDSATEKWFTYFPSGLGGSPFTIFYKDPTSVPPGVFNLLMLAFTELFYDLRTYDDLIYFPHNFSVIYDHEGYALSKPPEGSLSSFELKGDEYYQMVRRVYREYHLKKIDVLK